MRRRSRYAFPPAPTHCIISRHKPRSNAAVVHPIQSTRRIASHRHALAMRLPSSRFVPSSPFCFVDPAQNARFPNVPYRPYCCGLSVCCFQGSCCRWWRPAPRWGLVRFARTVRRDSDVVPRWGFRFRCPVHLLDYTYILAE